MLFGANVPIPELLKSRRTDKRGYPIPYIVYIDKNHKPQFTVNDAKMVKRVLFHNRCGLCGNKMGEIIYFIGGAASALHPNGAYLDPPMHKECALYALQVCPYIALRNYTGKMDEYTLPRIVKNARPGMEIRVDKHASVGKPDLFILLGTKGFVNMSDHTSPRLVPTSRDDIEYWKDGKRLDPEGEDGPYITNVIENVLQGLDSQTTKSISFSAPMTSLSALAR